VGALIGCRRLGVPLPFFADAVAPGIVTAQAIGRLGNYFNQELYGGPTTLPWGLEIYPRVVPGTTIPDPLGGVALDHTPVAVVHPTFLYELLWNLLVAALVVLADRKLRLGHGRAFAVYVAGYTFGRFWIELMRSDPATRVFGDVRINVVVSALVFLGAMFYLVVVRGPREDPASIGLGEPALPAPVPAGVPAAAAAAEGAEVAEPAAGTDLPESPTGTAATPAPAAGSAPSEGSAPAGPDAAEPAAGSGTAEAGESSPDRSG
jgi:hypothetical protein